jgi:hypothetical protein
MRDCTNRTMLLPFYFDLLLKLTISLYFKHCSCFLHFSYMLPIIQVNTFHTTFFFNACYWPSTTAFTLGMLRRDYVGKCLMFQGPSPGRAGWCVAPSTSVPFAGGCRHSGRQVGYHRWDEVIVAGQRRVCAQSTHMYHRHERWMVGIMANGTNPVPFLDLYALISNMFPNHSRLMVKLVASSHNRRQPLLHVHFEISMLLHSSQYAALPRI